VDRRGVLQKIMIVMEDREMMRRWVQAWKSASPELEAVRWREVRQADHPKALAPLEGAFNQTLRTLPPRPSSGMVEMQDWLAKLRR